MNLDNGKKVKTDENSSNVRYMVLVDLHESERGLGGRNGLY
jgi:hypothetical protein